MTSCGLHTSHYTPEAGALLTPPQPPATTPVMDFLKGCEVRSALIAVLVILLLKQFKML